MVIGITTRPTAATTAARAAIATRTLTDLALCLGYIYEPFVGAHDTTEYGTDHEAEYQNTHIRHDIL